MASSTRTWRARIVGAALALAVTGTLAVPAAAAEPVTYVDAADSGHAAAITWIGAQGIFPGDPVDGGRAFHGGKAITRAAMASWLYRYAGEPAFDAPATATFSDVPAGSKGSVAIEWAASRGIIDGYADGTFRPSRGTTRDGLAYALKRLTRGSVPTGSAVYADSKDARHPGAVEWAASEGLADGWLTWRGREYRPSLAVTRQTLALFLYRLSHDAAPITAVKRTVEAQQKVWITYSRVNLRKEPTWSSAVVVSGLKGAPGTYLGNAWNGWKRVKMGGIVGWSPAKYLTTTQPTAAKTKVGIKLSQLYFRSGPSNGYSVVTTAGRGTRGTFTGVIKGTWWLVDINGKRAWTPATHLNTVTTYNPAAILKVAHGQVGYRSPNWNHNKYNDWLGEYRSWCHVYVAWVFDKAGFAQGVPKRSKFQEWVGLLRDAGVLDTTPRGNMQKGDVVLVDWYPYDGPTHTGIVDHVDGEYVWLVEGNTPDGSGDPTRGVFYRKRAIVDIYAVFDPDDYARVNGF
ncbi:S-layer homology domain-containing protein [Demequina soli]|uniref:S-layer homology domain-containing protein n=1 Tax=Demequina soli TaxID=1638987 RepID=UPI0007830FF8|nr:S-layer homology domain-containing protein [Demequina soli]